MFTYIYTYTFFSKPFFIFLSIRRSIENKRVLKGQVFNRLSGSKFFFKQFYKINFSHFFKKIFLTALNPKVLNVKINILEIEFTSDLENYAT